MVILKIENASKYSLTKLHILEKVSGVLLFSTSTSLLSYG